MIALLWMATSHFGRWNVMKIYGFPYLLTNNWISEFFPFITPGTSFF